MAAISVDRTFIAELIYLTGISAPCVKTIHTELNSIIKLTSNGQSCLSVCLSFRLPVPATSPLMPHLVTNTFNSALPPQIMCHLHSVSSFSQELHLLSRLWPPPPPPPNHSPLLFLLSSSSPGPRCSCIIIMPRVERLTCPQPWPLRPQISS